MRDQGYNARRTRSVLDSSGIDPESLPKPGNYEARSLRSIARNREPRANGSFETGHLGVSVSRCPGVPVSPPSLSKPVERCRNVGIRYPDIVGPGLHPKASDRVNTLPIIDFPSSYQPKGRPLPRISSSCILPVEIYQRACSQKPEGRRLDRGDRAERFFFGRWAFEDRSKG